MQHFTSYISFTMRVYTSANSTAADPDPTRVLHQLICLRYAKRSQGTFVGAVLQMMISVVDKIRKELIQI
jgi:hypothetical protein